MIRLQKYLADCGVAARRKAEELILEGKVTVNSIVVTELGVKIDPQSDTVAVEGRTVAPEKKVYIMLHKPEGYVTTASDEHGRPTVMDLIRDVPERLSPVGRLDYNTSGMLIMTNDGELLYGLTHPRHEVEKTYIARVSGMPSDEGLRRLRKGLTLDAGQPDFGHSGRQPGSGRRTAPAKVSLVKSDGTNASLLITIHEGRNRQVRRMCEAIGHDVIHLKRISTGRLALGDLEKGKYRRLTGDEITYLKELGAQQLLP